MTSGPATPTDPDEQRPTDSELRQILIEAIEDERLFDPNNAETLADRLMSTAIIWRLRGLYADVTSGLAAEQARANTAESMNIKLAENFQAQVARANQAEAELARIQNLTVES